MTDANADIVLSLSFVFDTSNNIPSKLKWLYLKFNCNHRPQQENLEYSF